SKSWPQGRRGTMYETVLWATDASTEADGALEEALRLLQPGGRLIAFHCDERLRSGRSGGMPVVADENDRRRKLRAQVDQLLTDGIDAKLFVETTHHDTTREIARAAENCEADVIVCGTRGLGVVS